MNKYDDCTQCPVCGGINYLTIKDKIDLIATEVETECTECGHCDFWATGFYESGEWIDLTKAKI